MTGWSYPGPQKRNRCKKPLPHTQFWWSDTGWKNWNWREIGIGVLLVAVLLLCCAGLGMLYLHMVPVLINP